MNFMNPLAIIISGLSAMVVGYIWYSPKVFGTIWMKETGMTVEKAKQGNMAKIFGLATLFSIMIAFFMPAVVIHQWGALSLIGGNPADALPSYTTFMNDYQGAFRTFKHGALHGLIMGLFVALPVLGVNALYEQKSMKYILVNSGYWIVTLTVMGAIICGWK